MADVLWNELHAAGDELDLARRVFIFEDGCAFCEENPFGGVLVIPMAVGACLPVGVDLLDFDQPWFLVEDADVLGLACGVGVAEDVHGSLVSDDGAEWCDFSVGFGKGFNHG
jgi:hypothetical protein